MWEALDLLTLISFLLQVENYEALKRQASTDDIYGELRKQDREYFARILENQEKIMGKLAELTAD